MKTRQESETVLTFWFGAPNSPDYGRPRKIWFEKDFEFDGGIRDRFGALHARAVAGDLNDWAEDPRSCLALIILLDQFSRNLYRDDARAFANDGVARSLASRAVEHGFDRAVLPEMRTFFYLPFEHSEDLEDQKRSMRLVAANDGVADHESACDFARRHFEIIERFGRFPHRNATLGRASTPEELKFLDEPRSGF